MTASSRKSPRRILWAAVTVMVVVFSGLTYLMLQPRTIVIPPSPPEIPVELPKIESGEDGLPVDPISRVWYWRAEILAVAVPARLTPTAVGLLGLLASLLAAGLWWHYRYHASASVSLTSTQGDHAWLDGQETAGPTPAAAPDRLQGDLRVWAAVCCLDPEPPDPDSAQRLRERLGLQAEPWHIGDLRRDAGDPGLHWPAARRFTLLNWLLRSTPLDEKGRPVADSPAARAVRWWKVHYKTAGQGQGKQRKRPLARDQAPDKRRWKLEHALITLIPAPERAAARLQDLAARDREIREEIRERLAELRSADQLDPTWAPAEFERAMEGAAYLTWALGSLPPETQDILVKFGFGGEALRRNRKRPRPSRGLGFAVGTLTGLALAAGGSALHHWLNPPGIQLRSAAGSLADSDVLKAQTLRLIDDDRGRVTVGHPKGAVSAEAPTGARIQVAWHWGSGAEPNNPVRLAPGSAALVLQSGTLTEPIRPCTKGWPARALALIRAAPEQKAARRLAIRLLDSGSADRVWIGEEWERELQIFLGDDPLLNGNTRLLLVLPDGPSTPRLPREMLAPLAAWAAIVADYEELAHWLGSPGIEDLGQGPVRVLERNGAMPWYRDPQQEEDRRTGIAWVPVCAGTFTMGSDPQADKMAETDEVPAHTVALAAFDIARTETTNGQFRRFRPKHASTKDDGLPVVDVSWKDARKFCAWAGGDLPTEAQWEFAVRGGSTAPWSFGVDAERLGQYAWYRDNSGGRVHPAAEKQPNPLGLYDMHGNAWEWVRDRYGDYPKEAQVEPEGPRSGGSRVVRGGSSWLSPEGLRSADRVDVPLGGGGRRFGFRCMRVPDRRN